MSLQDALESAARYALFLAIDLVVHTRLLISTVISRISMLSRLRGEDKRTTGIHPPPLLSLCIVLPDVGSDEFAPHRDLEHLRTVVEWARVFGVRRIRIHERQPWRLRIVQKLTIDGIETLHSTEKAGLYHLCAEVESGKHLTSSSGHPEFRVPSEEDDAVFVFGEPFTLRGLSPIHSRAAEIFHVGALDDVTREGLDKVARRYSNVTQRMGA